MNEAQGIDLEVFEVREDEAWCVVPRRVRINGSEVLIPEGAVIEIGPVSEKSLVTATLTVIVKSLSIHQERPREVVDL